MCMRIWCSRLNLKWTTVIRLGEQVREAAVFQLRHDRMVQYQEGSFFFSRSRLQRGIVCIAQRNACAHHCTADMPMGLKKDEINTHKSTLIYLRKKPKLSPILVYVNWLDLLSRKQHALCAKVVIKLSWIVIRYISRQAMWARWSRVKFPFYSSIIFSRWAFDCIVSFR